VSRRCHLLVKELSLFRERPRCFIGSRLVPTASTVSNQVSHFGIIGVSLANAQATGRSATVDERPGLQEGDKGDLYRGPVFTNDCVELYHADRTTDT